MVQKGTGNRRRIRWIHPDAATAGDCSVMLDGGVKHIERRARGGVERDSQAGRACEIPDGTILNHEGGTGQKLDSAKSRTGSIEVQSLQNHDIIRAGGDGHAVGAGDEHPGGASFTGDRDGFGDRQSAKAARIDAVDFTAGGGLGNRAGKGLAWSSSAARVSIVTDT